MARAKPGSKAYFVALRAEAAAKGRCQKCRKRRAAKGRITCRPCLDKNYARLKALRAAGSCLHCKQMRLPGLKLCLRCQRRGIAKNRAMRRAWKAAGRCYDCGGTSPLSRALCGACTDDRRDRRIMNGRF